MNIENKTAAQRIVFRDVKPPFKTAAVEVTKWEALALLNGARDHLGRVVMEYEGQETFRFMIDGAKADAARWQAVLDAFN